MTRLPLLSCTSQRIWKQAQIEISLLRWSSDLNPLIEPKQIILIQVQMKTFQWLLWESKTASKIIWTEQQVLFPVRKVSVKLFAIHLEEIWNNTLWNAVGGSCNLLLTFLFFQILGFFFTYCCLHMQFCKALWCSQGWIFQRKFFIWVEAVAECIHSAAVLLSKCHRACLALIKLTLPKAGFQLHWWANPAGQEWEHVTKSRRGNAGLPPRL